MHPQVVAAGLAKLAVRMVQLLTELKVSQEVMALHGNSGVCSVAELAALADDKRNFCPACTAVVVLDPSVGSPAVLERTWSVPSVLPSSGRRPTLGPARGGSPTSCPSGPPSKTLRVTARLLTDWRTMSCPASWPWAALLRPEEGQALQDQDA